MPTEELRAKDMQLEPPRSLQRIASFLQEVTHTSAFEAMPDGAPPPIGSAGAGSATFAADVIGRASFAGLLPAQADRNALADKYSIQSRDVREFSQWLIKVRDKEEESENVVKVREVDRYVEGPERVVKGPARDLTAAEIDALLAQALKARPASAATATQTQTQTPTQTPSAPAYAGPTAAETRSAVATTNRAVWGANLGFGGLAAGMLFNPAAGATPGAAMGAASYGGAPAFTYLLRGVAPSAPQGFGGMAAFHGMPDTYGGAAGFGAPMGSYGSPDAGGYYLQPGFGPAQTPNGTFNGSMVPRVFDTAPGPQAMGLEPTYGSPGDGLTPGRYISATPQMGQVTLIAPPVQVASEGAQKTGSAVSFDWETLAKGSVPMDASALSALREMLPEGAQMIYPALPPEQLTAGAVNLNLAPSLSRQLMADGYGVSDLSLANQASAMASSSSGGSPSAMPLSASIIPMTDRPIAGSTSIMAGGSDSAEGHLAEAGAGQAQRGGALDFLGIPVRLAPTLGATSEARQEQAMRASIADPTKPQIVRPEQFAPLKNTMFSAFQSVSAEPDKQAWQKAAPAYGLRDAEPHTLLSPDSRVTMPSAGAPLPQTEGSSDPVGRSIGMASHASRAMEDARAAQPMESVASSAAPLSLSSPLIHAPMLGGHALGPEGTGPASAMASFTPSSRSFGFAGSGGSAPARVSTGSSASPSGGSVAMGSAAPAVSGISSGPLTPTAHTAAFHSAPVTQTASSLAPSHLPLMHSARPAFAPAGSASIQASPSATGAALPLVGGSRLSAVATRSSMTSARSSVSSTPAMMGSAMPTAIVAPTSSPTYGPTSISSPTLLPTAGRPAMGGRSVPTATPGPAATRIGAPSMPVTQSTSSAPSSLSTHVELHQELPLRMPPQAKAPSSGLILQASMETASTPASEASSQSHDSASSSERGNAAGDVNLLASEVWTLLKRRIATDAERHGLR